MSFCSRVAGTVAKLLALLAISPNLGATWSIILVDTRTGEVALGSATCVSFYDLRQLTAVIVVGKGGACAQSYVDFSGATRLLIFNEFKKGTDPAAILAALAKQDPGHQTRQYGIVDTQGRAIGFSGTGASAWKGHITGKVGGIAYAIQGNILTGAAVVTAAETAVKNTQGDLAAKMMAAMEAARKMGGDGRCSCTSGPPTSCGAPPASFTKSAHIGFMMIARQGDTDGACNGSAGCATGKYYQNLNVIGGGTNPDPVLTLKTLYDAWRKTWIGRPDHHLSTADVASGWLPNDGKTKTHATITLRDHTGAQLTTGGAKVVVTLDPGSTASPTIGTVTDNNDGTYTVPLTSGTKIGIAQLQITADDGKGVVLLSPRTEIPQTADGLWVSRQTLPVTTGGDLDFVINQGVANKDRLYMLMASNSGTTPGIWLGPSLTVPLNIDQVFWAVFWSAGSSSLPDFLGNLDGVGRREIRLPMPPGAYLLPVNTDLHFASLLFNPPGNVSDPVPVRLVR